MNEADRKIVRDALQGILDDDGRETSLADQRKNWESRMRASNKALAILDADRPTVPMEMLRELNGDWVHSSLDYAVRESLIEIASRFGYEVTE